MRTLIAASLLLAACREAPREPKSVQATDAPPEISARQVPVESPKPAAVLPATTARPPPPPDRSKIAYEWVFEDIQTLLKDPESTVQSISSKTVHSWPDEPGKIYEFGVPAIANEHVNIRRSGKPGDGVSFICVGCLIKPTVFGQLRRIYSERGREFYELTSGPFKGFGLEVIEFERRVYPNIAVYTAENALAHPPPLHEMPAFDAIQKWARSKRK